MVKNYILLWSKIISSDRRKYYIVLWSQFYIVLWSEGLVRASL